MTLIFLICLQISLFGRPGRFQYETETKTGELVRLARKYTSIA